MGTNHLLVERHGEIADVVFNRPEKRNALNYDMWLQLIDIVDEVDRDPSVKVVIFRGVNETAFAAGADISEFESLRGNAEGAQRYNQATVAAEQAIGHMTKPTIAMIRGYCVGGGCEIAVACDFRFTDETGRFGITPAKLGLVYAMAGTKTLVDLVGPAKAKDMLFSGRLMDAQEAFRIGLVDRVYSAEELEHQTLEYARTIARNAQFSVRGAKYVIRRVLDGAVEEPEDVTKLILESFETKDYQEGVKAFLEKRRPHFTWT